MLVLGKDRDMSVRIALSLYSRTCQAFTFFQNFAMHEVCVCFPYSCKMSDKCKSLAFKQDVSSCIQCMPLW